MLKLKIRAIIAAFIIVTFTAATPVMADTLSDKLKQEQKILQQNRNTYDDIEGQIAANEADIQKMDEQINGMLDQINDTNGKVILTQQDIEASQKEIEKAKEQLKINQDKFAKRVRNIYMSGLSGYFNLLLESESFSDFILRMEMAAIIIGYDNKEIAMLKNEKEQLNQKRIALMNKNDNLIALQKDNQQKIIELNSTKETQSKMIAQLKEKEQAYSNRVDQYQAMVDSTLKQIQASKIANKQNGQPVLASRGGSIIASGNSVVEYAVNFLGVPYVYGGITPSGFDCSGFTRYVFAHFGVSLNRRARDQAYQGVPVSKDALRPGDLVFFGSPAYHVGIYIGNGMFIHAPETGDVVKISPLRYMYFSGARRVK